MRVGSSAGWMVGDGRPTGAWKAPSERTKASGPFRARIRRANAAGGLSAKGISIAVGNSCQHGEWICDRRMIQAESASAGGRPPATIVRPRRKPVRAGGLCPFRRGLRGPGDWRNARRRASDQERCIQISAEAEMTGRKPEAPPRRFTRTAGVTVSGFRQSSGSAYPMRWRGFSRQHPRAQAKDACAHRRLRADVLRSGCLRLLCALPRTRRFWLPFPLEAVRNSG